MHRDSSVSNVGAVNGRRTVRFGVSKATRHSCPLHERSAQRVSVLARARPARRLSASEHSRASGAIAASFRADIDAERSSTRGTGARLGKPWREAWKEQRTPNRFARFCCSDLADLVEIASGGRGWNSPRRPTTANHARTARSRALRPRTSARATGESPVRDSQASSN